MEPRITLITLSVTDLERALAFYRDGLGLPTKGIEADEVIFFRLSGAWLALFLRDKHAADAGVPEDEAHLYSEGVRRGGTLLTVRVEDSRAASVEAALDRYRPADMRARGQEYRNAGWTRFDPTAPPPS